MYKDCLPLEIKYNFYFIRSFFKTGTKEHIIFQLHKLKLKTLNFFLLVFFPIRDCKQTKKGQ